MMLAVLYAANTQGIEPFAEVVNRTQKNIIMKLWFMICRFIVQQIIKTVILIGVMAKCRCISRAEHLVSVPLNYIMYS